MSGWGPATSVRPKNQHSAAGISTDGAYSSGRPPTETTSQPIAAPLATKPSQARQRSSARPTLNGTNTSEHRASHSSSGVGFMTARWISTELATKEAATSSARACFGTLNVTESSGRAALRDQLRESPQRREGARHRGVVGLELDAVLLLDREHDLERVDRIEAPAGSRLAE